MGDCLSEPNAKTPLNHHHRTSPKTKDQKIEIVLPQQKRPTVIQKDHQHEHRISINQLRKNLAMLKSSIFFKTLKQQLEAITQTEKNLFDIIQTIDSFTNCLLQNKLTEQQNQQIQVFIQTKSLQQLTYPQLIQQWQQNHKTTNFSTKSTLYHNLTFQKQNLKVQLEDFNELIQLQRLEHQVEKLAKDFGQRKNIIKKETENIQWMVQQCGNHATVLGNLSYNIERQEIKVIGSISKYISGRYDKGIYVLLQYFMKAIQIQSMNTHQKVIQEQVIKAIGYLIGEYSYENNSQITKEQSFQNNFEQQLRQIVSHSVIEYIKNLYRNWSKNIKQNIDMMMIDPVIQNEKVAILRLFFDVVGASKLHSFEQISEKFQNFPTLFSVNVIKYYDYVLTAIFKRTLGTINVSLLQKLEEDKYTNKIQFSKMFMQMFNLQFFKADQPVNLYRTIEYSYEQYLYDQYYEVFGVDELTSSKAILKRQQLEYLCNKSGQELGKSPGDKIIEIYGEESSEYSKYLVKQSKILQYRQEFDKSMQSSEKVLRNFSVIQGNSQKQHQMFDYLSSAYFIILQNHLISGNLIEASQVLINISIILHRQAYNQEYQQVFKLLNAECQLYSNKSFQLFLESHKQIVRIFEKRTRSKLLVHQFLIDAEWRVGRFLIKLGEEQLNQQILRYGFQYCLMNALYQYSDQTAQDFLKKLYEVKAFELQDRFAEQRLCFKKNEKIKIFGSQKQQPIIFFTYLSRSNWPNLQKLYLQNNILQKQHFEILGSGLHTLTSLQLNHNHISITGYQSLIKQPWLNLSKLFLDDNNIECQQLKLLIKGEWPCLETLSLANNKIGDEGCFLLSEANWPNLNSLNIKNNEITDIGVQNICKANYQRLQIFQLQQNQISGKGCQFFTNKKWNIKMLCLRDNMLDDLGLSQFQGSLPDTVIDTVL